jgi:cytochrome bd-type quinol oxidase subunit 1
MPMLAAAIPYIMAATAAASAAAAYNAGQQQKKAANYQAQVETQAAHNAADVAGANALAKQQQNRVQIGNAAAALAQSGGWEQGGTGLLALHQSAVNQQLDTMNIQYGGVQNANAYGNQATLSQFQGQNAATTGTMNAVGQLFSSAGSYYRYSQNPSVLSNQG